jgi:hypothetical protein
VGLAWPPMSPTSPREELYRIGKQPIKRHLRTLRQWLGFLGLRTVVRGGGGSCEPYYH